MSDYFRQQAIDSQFNIHSWVILGELEQSIKDKISAVGIPLKEWDVRINYGLKTGFNGPLSDGGCFIITKEKRDELVQNCAEADEIIRPILRGRDISKYNATWANLYLIHIPWHFPLHEDETIVGVSNEAERLFIENYPAVYNHLIKYKYELSERNKAETGIRYEWYALQRWGANYRDDFFKPKIVWGEISDRSKFAYDEDGYLVEATSFLLTGAHLKYLVGMLNSLLLEWHFNLIGTATGVGTNRWKKYTIEQLPIIKPTPQELSKFEALVDAVLKNPCSESLIKKVDHMVYELYKLTPEQIDFIESHRK